MTKTFIREMFVSIQGEGPHIGEEQIFVRFCGCNLKCKYCDTDFDRSKSVEYTAEQFLSKIDSFRSNGSISLTGGEPLLSVDFLSEVLPALKKKGYIIYLETNGTLPENLKRVIHYVDIVAADLKLQSATGIRTNKNIVYDFFDIAKQKETFAKIVFNSDITEEEILFAAELAQKYDIELILQPEMSGDKFSVSVHKCEEIFSAFKEKYDKIRLIPQMHKFLNVR